MLRRRVRVALLTGAVIVGALALGGCKDYLTETPKDFYSGENFPASEVSLRVGAPEGT